MNPDFVIDFFCTKNDVTRSDVLSGKRALSLWTTRYMIWFYLHNYLKISANKLAKKFGRNRPTIFRGIRIFRHDMKLYKDVRIKYESLIQEMEDIAKSNALLDMEET